MASRLAIGTAQFGLPYGISNRAGQVPVPEVAAILAAGRRAGLDVVDTAIVYGSSEEALGAAGISGWKVVSKLPPVPAGCDDIRRWVAQTVHGTLARLRVDRLYAFLVHEPADLGGPVAADLRDALLDVQADGWVTHVGVSVDDPDDLAPIIPAFAIGVVQAPFNVFDRRLARSGWLARLKDRGVEVHARSAFLQGLLLMSPDARPGWFGRWAPHWQRWHQWLEESGQTAARACLGTVLGEPGVDRVVVGVESAAQLAELVALSRAAAVPAPAELASTDPLLILPSRWMSA